MVSSEVVVLYLAFQMLSNRFSRYSCGLCLGGLHLHSSMIALGALDEIYVPYFSMSHFHYATEGLSENRLIEPLQKVLKAVCSHCRFLES